MAGAGGLPVVCNFSCSLVPGLRLPAAGLLGAVPACRKPVAVKLGAWSELSPAQVNVCCATTATPNGPCGTCTVGSEGFRSYWWPVPIVAV